MPIHELLEKVKGKLNEEREFSVMRYMYPARTLLKILLDEDTQFTSEIFTLLWPHEYIRHEEVELLYYDLFTKQNVVGNISMREILHDAKTSEIALSGFFQPNPNSAYKDKYPIGTNCGKVTFQYVKDNTLGLMINDLSKRKNISGDYEMVFTDLQEYDSKGRSSTVVKLKMK